MDAYDRAKILGSTLVLLGKIKETRDSSFLRDIGSLDDSVVYFVDRLKTSQFCSQPSHLVLEALRLYKQNLDSGIDGYKKGHDFEHVYWDISRALEDAQDVKQVTEILAQHEKVLKERFNDAKKEKNYKWRAARHRKPKVHPFLGLANLTAEKLRLLAQSYGLKTVGRTDGELDQVYCYDVENNQRLDPRYILVNDIDDPPPKSTSDHPTPPNTTQPPPPPPTTTLPPPSPSKDPSIPLPAINNPFPPGFVTSGMVHKQKFQIFTYGTVYGFARAPNGTYSMVFAVQFTSIDRLSPVKREAVGAFVDFVPAAAKHAYQVKGNAAQNAEDERQGELYSTGWRPGRTQGEKYGEYTAQSAKDQNDPTGYLDLHMQHPVVNTAWMTLQESLSPRAVLDTISTLREACVPLFGSHEVDIVTHGPSLGSNMAVSKHDCRYQGFANGMHIDCDIDALEKYYGQVFTFGLWFHTDAEGNLIDGPAIKNTIPDGLFVLPGYGVGFDLGAAAVTTAIWRGGMDIHGTTTSQVSPDAGITRWGMSIQTNKALPQRVQSQKGAVFGVFERLQQYYESFA